MPTGAEERPDAFLVNQMISKDGNVIFRSAPERVAEQMTKVHRVQFGLTLTKDGFVSNCLNFRKCMSH